MANKAAKSQAVRNTALLSRLHIIALAIHGLFLLLRVVIFRNISIRAFGVYTALSLPAALIEFWFERNSRPTYNAQGDLARAGDDLEAKGLTEYMFDILYWSWGTIVLAALFGNKAFYLWTVVPIYSVYAAWKAYGGVKDAMGGLAGAANQGGEGPQSNRQKKMDKRGGQKVQYR